MSYEIRGNLGVFQYCHCSRCRKVTGSAFASNLFVAPEDFTWLSGQEKIRRYELETAKYFATSFCENCGSSLPWLAKTGKAVVVPAGTLDGDPEVRPVQNIFCGSRALWYEAPNTLVEYDELPPRRR